MMLLGLSAPIFMMKFKNKHQDQLIAFGGFGISTVLTWFFIKAFTGYISQEQMLLSGAIAGGKWALQLALAWFRLGEKRWCYYREQGIVCGVGSLILLPYILLPGSWEYFMGSLILSVAVMSFLVVWRLASISMGKSWIILWFMLLVVAVSLQLTVVFDVL